MHPCCSPRATPFQLYAEHGAAFGLAGTLSDGSVHLLLAALRRLGEPTGSELGNNSSAGTIGLGGRPPAHLRRVNGKGGDVGNADFA
jgi:hypothetical protein